MKQSLFRIQNCYRTAIFVAAAGLLGWGCTIPAAWGQWFACQCGGPCEGAEPPPFDMPASCEPERGETVDGVYYPCRGNGIFCGLACSLCDPEDENCDTKEKHTPNRPERLCDRNLNCVIASEAYCF